MDVRAGSITTGLGVAGVALAVLGLVAVAPEAAAEPDAPPKIRFSGETSVYETRPEPPSERMYRFTDASGSVRMVRGIEHVPPAFRAMAIDLAASRRGSVNRADAATTGHRWSDYEPDFNPNTARVVVFSAASCGACARTRSHLDRRGVTYYVRDIHDDPGAWDEVERVLGRVVVPLLVIDGEYLSGFDPSAIDRMLGG